MAETRKKLSTLDPVWQRITDEARTAIDAEARLGGLMHASVLSHECLETALAYRMAIKLASRELSEQSIRAIADEAYASDPDLAAAARADIVAVFDRDPACTRFSATVAVFQGISSGSGLSCVSLALAAGAHRSGIFHPDAHQRSLRRRHSSGRADRARDHDRPMRILLSSAKRQWSVTTSQCCTR